MLGGRSSSSRAGDASDKSGSGAGQRHQRLRRRVVRLSERLAAQDAVVQHLQQSAAEQVSAAERAHADQVHRDRRLDAIERSLEERFATMDGLLAHVTAVPGDHSGALRAVDPEGRTVMGYADAVPLDEEAAYVDFENHFRGSRELIQERQRPYLDLLRGRDGVLDLGCGRGEFLELLREAGIPARGVDLDAGMVAEARERSLDASVGDLFDTLAACPDASLDAVVSFQVAEHLPPDRLRVMLHEVRRVLRDGGLAILETVNPHSLRAYRFFWLDLTHVIPLFPESFLSLTRGCGFSAAVALFPESSGDLAHDLRECGDYAVVCAKTPSVLREAGVLGA
jgi:SAM-dependent methyltransferase